MNNDEKYMRLALLEAKKAYDKDEVPVGAVIVRNDKVLAKGHNLRESKNDPTMHAEIVATRKACKKLNSWRLEGATIYVTIEPCSMCAGTILWARMDKVVYGASDPKGGSLGGSFNLYEMPNLNHHPQIVGGVLKEECGELMSKFFKSKRVK